MVGHDDGDGQCYDGGGDGYDGQNFEVQFLAKLITLNDVEGINE